MAVKQLVCSSFPRGKSELQLCLGKSESLESPEDIPDAAFDIPQGINREDERKHLKGTVW